MGNYADKLRRERRAELAKRVLPQDTIEDSVVACGDDMTKYNHGYDEEDGPLSDTDLLAKLIKIDIKVLNKIRSHYSGRKDIEDYLAGLDKAISEDLHTLVGLIEAGAKAEAIEAMPAPAPSTMYADDEVVEFLGNTELEFALPPFMKANIIKGLKKKLDEESDPEKKAEIQAKIDKLK